MDLGALQLILSMCASNPVPSEMVTPKITISWTLSMPGMRGGRAIGLDLGCLTTISLVLAWFNLRLLMDAHLEIQYGQVLKECCQCRKQGPASSYRRFSLYLGLRLEMAITKSVGPRPEPC